MNDQDLSANGSYLDRVTGFRIETSNGVIEQTNRVHFDPGSMRDRVLVHWLDADGFTVLARRMRDGVRDYEGRIFALSVTQGERRAVSQLRELYDKRARERPRAL